MYSLWKNFADLTSVNDKLAVSKNGYDNLMEMFRLQNEYSFDYIQKEVILLTRSDTKISGFQCEV